MKILIFWVMAVLLVYADETLDEARRLYELKKYKEAYELLDSSVKVKKADKTESKTLNSHESFFGGGSVSRLRTYKNNYVMPFSYRLGGSYRSYDPSDSYTKTEAKLQISLAYDFYYDLLGLNETYSLGYTQKSFWQIYKHSRPFRETNYNPEIFVTVPLDKSYKEINLEAVKFAIEHHSNGQGDITYEDLSIDTSNLSKDDKYWLSNSSRSWNYASVEFLLRYHKLKAAIKLWHRFKEDIKNDDNPDLIDHIGFGELNLYYPHKKHEMFLRGRYNFAHNLGSIELSYAYPILESKNIFWFINFFSGFEESLIDYNHRIDKISFGMRFLYP